MSSTYFKARKIQDPYILEKVAQNRYGSSLTALNDAWSSVAAAKKELTDVDIRIQQSSSHDTRKVEFCDFPPPPSRKSKDNPNIEKRLVYEEPYTKYRKENIPPVSYAVPSLKTASSSYQDLPQLNSLHDFIPTRKQLYDVRSSTTEDDIPDFHYDPENFQPKANINSSLFGRSLLTQQQKSNALNRLKEKINQQKLNSSISSSGSSFPEKKIHIENDPVHRTENRVSSHHQMLRKVTVAPSAPSYKGFNEPDSIFKKSHTTHKIRKQRQYKTAGKAEREANSKQKSNLGKKKIMKGKQKSKTKRIIAEEKPANPATTITTSSWRIGQEIRNKILQERKEKSKELKEPLPTVKSSLQEETKSDFAPSNHDNTNLESWLKDQEEIHRDGEEESTDNELKEQFLDDPLVSGDEEAKDTADENEDEEDDLLALQDSKMLPTTAKYVLKEMNFPSEGSSSPPRRKVVTAVIDTGLKKSQKIKLSKRSPPVKRKIDEEMNPKRKARHYDKDEIQKYMIKQQKERKKKKLEEKYQQQHMKEIQEKKLQDLYNKQKNAVKESLEVRRCHKYGDTFIKYKPSKRILDVKEYASEAQTVSEVCKLFVGPKQANSSHKENTLDEEVFKDSLDEQGFTGLTEVMTQRKVLQTKALQLYPSHSATDHTASLSDRSSSSYYELPQELSKVDDDQPPFGVNKTKADRVAAIRATAATLRQRLDIEAKRLSNLVQNKQEDTRWAHPIVMDESTNGTDLHGEVPGTGNIDEQALLNNKLRDMDEAARKIQALYRGHTVRSGMNWQLPSGKSLYQTLEEGRRRAFLSDVKSKSPFQFASHSYPSILKSDFEPVGDVAPFSNNSLEKLSSTASLIGKALQSSNVLLSDAEKSVSNITSKKLTSKASTSYDIGEESFPSYDAAHEPTPFPKNKEYEIEKLRNILEKHKNTEGDRYSVINIFARNYPSLQRRQLEREAEVLKSLGTETENLLADAHEHEAGTSAEPSSLDEYMSEPSYKDLADFKQLKPGASSFKLPATTEVSTTANIPAHRSLMSPHFTRSDSDTSERLFSPCSPRQEPLAPKIVRTENNTLKTPTSIVCSVTACESSENSTLVSSTRRSPASFSDIDQNELNPVLTSTKRSPSSHDKQDISGTPLSHIERPPQIKIGNRMSPNTLERRLRAEINMFDSVGDSLQQLNEMERVQNIVQAQQETVSLAQVLKSRHVAHQQDLERLSLDAKEKSRVSAHQVEAARLATAEASANAMKAIAEIKTKATEDVTYFAKQFTDAQQHATTATLDAVNRVENARQSAADAYKVAVERQITDVEKLATAAATAASSTAVNMALQHHRQQLEELRKNAFRKVSDAYSSSEFSKSSEQTNTISSGTKVSSYSDDFERDADVSEKLLSDRKADESTSKGSSTLTPRISSHKDSTCSTRSSVTHTQTPKNSTPIQTDDSKVSEPSSSVKKKTATNDRITEELLSEDKELSEALFSTRRGSSVQEEESIHSVQSEEKFHSSFTVEELKHDFRMVLPSENHRRKSFGQKEYLISGCETSSDELVAPRTKWTKKRSAKSPFVDEDTFTKFTADMVRQYVQEEEVRAKHQNALLELREKAIIEKTTAEMTFLEMQKKSLKTKGSDEKMPPITKKQRALLMKLQAEQSEIRKLKDAHKKASYERQSLLHQEKEIQKIRESTQKLWNKMDSLDQSHPTTQDDENNMVASMGRPRDKVKQESGDSAANNNNSVVSDEVPEELADATESISEAVKQPTSSQSSTANNAKNMDSTRRTVVSPTRQSSVTPVDNVSDASSVSQDLRKLKYMASKRYLTEREKKVQMRKQQFHEIIERKSKLKNWKQQIINEEQKLKAEIRRVLEKGRRKLESSNQASDAERTISNHSVSPTSQKRHEKVSPREKHSETDTSIGEYASSIAEDYSSEKDSKDDSVVEAISKPNSSSSTSHTKSISETASSQVTKPSTVESMKKMLSTSPKADTAKSDKYSSDTFEDISRTQSEKNSATASKKERRRSEDDSFTEGTSDASDIEQRLKGLENELYKRRSELEHLRKKKQKENLRRKEQELRRELLAVEQQINRENKENVPEAGTRIQQPRVLSPRNSLDSIILPEKIKFPTEKESRRSLDFSDKESDNDRTLTDHINFDTKATRHVSSTSDTVITSKKTVSEKDKNITKLSTTEPVHSITEASPVKSLSKPATADDVHSSVSDKSPTVSSISQHAQTEKNDTTLKISIAEELSGSSGEASDKIAEDIYDDDFFGSTTHKTLSEKGDGDNNDYYDDDLEMGVPSTRYSSRFDSSDSVLENGGVLQEVVSNRSLAEQISEALENLSERSSSSVHSRVPKEEVASVKSSDSHSSSSKRSSKVISARKFEHEARVRIDENEILSHHENEAAILLERYDTLRSSGSTSKASSSSSSVAPQPDAFSKSNASSAFGFHLNDRVLVEDTMVGTIRFLGKTSFSPVLVAGVELDKAIGTNNGTFQGKQYFVCSQDFGLFTTVERMQLLDGDEKKDTALSGSSTVDDVEESLSHQTLTPEYDDDFEKSSKSTSREHAVDDDVSRDKYSTSVTADEKLFVKSSSTSSVSVISDIASVASVRSDDAREVSQSANKFFKEQYQDINDQKFVDLEVKSRSSSDIESLDGEIPSPAKLDLTPLADTITDSIMKSLLAETMQVSTKPVRGTSEAPEKRELREISEAYVTPKLTKTSIDKLEAAETVVKSVQPAVVASTDLLMKEAISFMVRVRHDKEEKLKRNFDLFKLNERKLNDMIEEVTLAKDNLFSLINDKDIGSPDEPSVTAKKEIVDSRLLAEKLNQLKDVHDQLGALIGDDDDDDDVEDELKLSADEDFILPPQGFETEDVVLEIPFNEESTRQLAYNAFDKILRGETEFDESETMIDFGEDENLDEASTKLYQELVFDVTKSLLYDIKDFRDLQRTTRPKWMKIPRRTFSKFTRKTHALKEDDLREMLANHICSCLDLTSGRPSLEQLKRRFPLNLAKKDYVDAVLVDELREEEAQWVNYDEDELRVKFQLADAILDNLINEIVQILSAVFP